MTSFQIKQQLMYDGGKMKGPSWVVSLSWAVFRKHIKELKESLCGSSG